MEDAAKIIQRIRDEAYAAGYEQCRQDMLAALGRLNSNRDMKDDELVILSNENANDFAHVFRAVLPEPPAMSVRTSNALRREGIYTIGDLAQRTRRSLQDIRNFGKKSLEECSEVLASYGLRLAY